MNTCDPVCKSGFVARTSVAGSPRRARFSRPSNVRYVRWKTRAASPWSVLDWRFIPAWPVAGTGFISGLELPSDREPRRRSLRPRRFFGDRRPVKRTDIVLEAPRLDGDSPRGTGFLRLGGARRRSCRRIGMANQKVGDFIRGTHRSNRKNMFYGRFPKAANARLHPLWKYARKNTARPAAPVPWSEPGTSPTDSWKGRPENRLC
jgi:hypothetical protein